MNIINKIKDGLRPRSAYREAVSAQELFTAITEGQKRLEDTRASLAKDFVFGPSPVYSKTDLVKGDEMANLLYGEMHNAIQRKLNNIFRAEGNSLDPRQDKVSPKEIHELLQGIVDNRKLGEAKSDQVVRNLIDQFIEGVNDSLRGKVYPFAADLSRSAAQQR